MAITRSKKEELFNGLKDIASGEGTRVFVSFKGLSVGDATALRRSLKKEGVSYVVAKKTLAKKAFSEAKLTGEQPELPGELAIAWSDDLLASPREVYNASKTLKDKITIVGGVFESKYMTAEEMMSIALIPPREVLYAQFVNLINSPIQRLAVALDQIAQTKTV